MPGQGGRRDGTAAADSVPPPGRPKDGFELVLGRPVDVVSARAIRSPYIEDQVLASSELIYAVCPSGSSGTPDPPSTRSLRSPAVGRSPTTTRMSRPSTTPELRDRPVRPVAERARQPIVTVRTATLLRSAGSRTSDPAPATIRLPPLTP